MDVQFATISDSIFTENSTGVIAGQSTLRDSVVALNHFFGVAAYASSLLGNTIESNHIGLDIRRRTVFGSNNISSNQTDISDVPGLGISQHNNACASGPC